MNQEITEISVDKSGMGIPLGNILFRVKSTQPFGDRSLGNIQEIYGFDPAGYGMGHIKRTEEKGTLRGKPVRYFISEWICSATAD